ncbi:hypothetical protein C9374_004072 [Naegleria lovaniensis]|uniref:Uncharacterized protein n=1 Tax=Naegleria lovaniensis TaxID=51637 RepID=A0AA88GLT7_NAELO|nr:uncharacterized protein C9374_004072 [Naegleria lovaniensis]KAG2383401.1 hypothetical protein C9374_004072 [Naegleria lovaniensis]
MADSINHVQVKEGITESNIHFFYFVICTDHCVKIMKWEKIHKDSMKSLMCIERHGKRALQSSTIQDLLCVIWEDGLVVYKISYSKGKFEPISNLLLCGGRIRQLLAIEAEGWIVVQETSNRVLELPLREESSSIKSVTKATTTGITLVQKNSIEETSYCVESNTTLQENEVVTLSKKPIRNNKPILLNNSLILPELDLSNRILNDQEEEHHEKFPSKIIFIKAEQNQIKIANEETGILTKFPDMIYGVHDRLQNSIFHIVTANRTEPQLEYIEYNYKSPNDSTTQLIRLEKHQRLLGLDISHQQPSLDNVLIIQALSGEREKQVGGIFFCNIKKNALENFENISLTKFMRKIHIQEDPNVSTPVTPYLNNSPRGDPFGSASPILVHQQNTLINTILRELREMKTSVDNKLDIILTEMHSLENRVKRIENHLQMEKK